MITLLQNGADPNGIFLKNFIKTAFFFVKLTVQTFFVFIWIVV